MIAALWSNSNWDDTKEEKGHRKRVIDDLNEQHKEAIVSIEDAFSSRVVPDEKKLADDNPFFAAADRGLAKVEAKVKSVRGDNSHKEVAEEEVDYMRGLDQE